MKVTVLRFVMSIALSNAYVHCVCAQQTPVPLGASYQVEYLDRLKRLAHDERREISAIVAMKVAAKFIKKSHLSCELIDARQVVDGSVRINGQTASISAYEAACNNGIGYFLVSQDRKPSAAISCFSIATANDDATTHSGDRLRNQVPVSCGLPANKDIKLQAANLLKGLNASCTVNGVSSFGVNATNRTEYVEVACADKIGYVLVIPQQTNATTQVSVMSCQDAARHGLQCHLTNTNSDAAPVTMQTLRDGLEQNGVHCTAPKLRLIGREQVKKRYVVEVQCPEQPAGLIAYIPINDNAQKFETVACKAVSNKNLSCKLNTK